MRSEKSAEKIDTTGKPAKPVTSTDKYEKGRKTLEELTGKTQVKPAPGFGEFNPVIDRFLKEHLFADIFGSDLLTYRQRELATIAALSMMPGTEPQLQAHFSIGTNIGITESEIWELLEIVGPLKQSSGAGLQNHAQNEFLKFQVAGKTSVDHETSNKHMIRIAEIEIFPEYFDVYMSILKAESAASVEKEPGVISIFPMAQKENPAHIRILEFYKDYDAYKSHLTTPHFQHYKTNTLHMVKDLKLVDMYVIDAHTMPLIFKKLESQSGE